MKKWLLATLLASLAGCHSSSETGPPGTMTADGQVIRTNQVPVAVNAAFTSEHPYAKITQAAYKPQPDGTDQYTIQYTRPDNSTGKAVYAGTGALLSDN